MNPRSFLLLAMCLVATTTAAAGTCSEPGGHLSDGRCECECGWAGDACDRCAAGAPDGRLFLCCPTSDAARATRWVLVAAEPATEAGFRSGLRTDGECATPGETDPRTGARLDCGCGCAGDGPPTALLLRSLSPDRVADAIISVADRRDAAADCVPAAWCGHLDAEWAITFYVVVAIAALMLTTGCLLLALGWDDRTGKR